MHFSCWLCLPPEHGQKLPHSLWVSMALLPAQHAVNTGQSVAACP